MIGVFGKSVEIIWTITKEEPVDTVSNTRLYLGKELTAVNQLFTGNPDADELTRHSLATKTFGDRIQATLKELKYILTLSNLSFSDTFTFTLVVSSEFNTTLLRKNLIESATITEVRGRHFFKNYFNF